MKRARDVDIPPCQKQRNECCLSTACPDNKQPNLIQNIIVELDRVQDQLQNLDEECARQQVDIQRQFDAQKKPFFEQRAEIIKKIPLFWVNVLYHHPALRYMIPQDIEILNHLEKIELDDNLDENGSYKLMMEFASSVTEFMDELKLCKHIEFVDGVETVKEITRINWKPDKSPIEIAKSRRASGSSDNYNNYSIFEWFSDDPVEEAGDLGEIIRRDIWHVPLPYYLDAAEDPQQVGSDEEPE